MMLILPSLMTKKQPRSVCSTEQEGSVCAFRPDLELPSALGTIAVLRGQTDSRVFVPTPRNFRSISVDLKSDLPDWRARVASCCHCQVNRLCVPSNLAIIIRRDGRARIRISCYDNSNSIGRNCHCASCRHASLTCIIVSTARRCFPSSRS